MSIEYSITPVLGYRIGPDDVGAHRGAVPARVHAEARFDPLTGKRVSDEAVVDEESHDSFFLDQDRFESFYDFGVNLAGKLGCEFVEAGSHVEGNTWGYLSVCGPWAYIDDYPLYAAHHRVLDGNEAQRLAQLKLGLAELGIVVGSPVLAAAVLIS